MNKIAFIDWAKNTKQTNTAREEGLWRQPVGLKVNEADQILEASKCQEICI